MSVTCGKQVKAPDLPNVTGMFRFRDSKRLFLDIKNCIRQVWIEFTLIYIQTRSWMDRIRAEEIVVDCFIEVMSSYFLSCPDSKRLC